MARKKEGRRDNHTGQIVEDGKFFRARVEIGRHPKTGYAVYKTARCKTRTTAVEALDRLLAERRGGAGEQVDRLNFGQFLTRWLEDTIKPTRSANTYRQYAWLVRDHIKPHLGAKQADKILRSDVQRLLATKANQTISPRDKDKKSKPTDTLSGNTLRLIRAVVRAALKEAKLQGLTLRNPAEGVDLPRTKRTAKKQFLTPDETINFTKELNGSDLADFFAFLISTGTRIGEASAVRWQDIDLTAPNRPVVWIRGQLQRIAGKLEYVRGTKTNQDRCLPLGEALVKRIQAINAARMIDGKPDADGIVFLNAEGRRIDPKHANSRLAELCDKAGVGRISAHKLRHTAATIMLAATGDLHAVQKTLGHSQVTLTANLYGHATAETLRPVMDQLDRALKAKRPG